MTMQTFGIQLRKELLELWRTRKFIIVLAVLVGFGMLSPILAKITPDLLKSMGENQMQGITITIPEPSTKDAIDQFVKNLTQFGLLLAVLMSFGVIVGERERGQAALIFAHPLPRTIFVLAKFVALAILFGVGIVLSGTAAYAYTAILFDPPNVAGYIALVGLMYLWLLALIAVSLLASTLGRTVLAAGGIAFLFVVFFLLGGTLATLAPGTLNTWGRDLALTINAHSHWGALVVTLVVIAGAVGASSILLSRQEIE
jgi:ABC-2 type transport system permease protein